MLEKIKFAKLSPPPAKLSHYMVVGAWPSNFILHTFILNSYTIFYCVEYA